MKKKAVHTSPYLFLLLALVVLGCEENTTPETKPTANFTSVISGLRATFTNTSTEATTYSWDFGDNTKSADKSPVHDYTNAGSYKVILTAMNNAGSSGKFETIQVAASPVPVASVVLQPETLSLAIGANMTLTATVLPTTATDKTLTWTSLNTDIATVTADGTVTAKQMAGTARIVAVSNDNDAARDTVKVTVVPPSVASVAIDQEDFELLVNTGTTVTATVLPANAVQTVTWTSLDPTIATVATDNADVTTVTTSAMNTGSARIVATSAGTSSIKDTVIVTVVSPANSVSITGETTFNLGVNASRTLTATVLPASASQKVIWESNDETVATVTVNGGVVTGVATGRSAQIKAKSVTNPNVESTVITVNVTPAVTKVDITNADFSLPEGSSGVLIVSVSPIGRSSTDLTWTSSDETIATVADGVVTAVGQGVATITATSPSNSNVNDSITVTVTAAASR